MSKYNLTNILNEYIGGSRHGTINISYRDLQDAMDQVEANGDFIVREKHGQSGDGKVNREFEVVFVGDVKGDNKQEELGFTVYDYKFGFDPGSEDNFDEVLPFSVGGSNKEAALKIAKFLLGNRIQGYMASDKEILKDFDPKDLNDVLFKGEVVNEENVVKDLAQADEVIKMIKMMNPDVRADLLMRIARMGQKMDENRREKNPVGIGQLYVQPAVQKEIKFHLDAYDKGDIEVDDMIQAIEDIIFGRIPAPGMREGHAMSDNEADLEAGVKGNMDAFTEEIDVDLVKQTVARANNQIVTPGDLAEFVLDVIKQVAEKEQDSILNNNNIKQAMVLLDKAKNATGKKSVEENGHVDDYADEIKEVDNVEVTTILNNVRKHLVDKFDSRYSKPEFDLYMDSLERDMRRSEKEFVDVKSMSMDDHEADFEDYIRDRYELEENQALKEHFKRFMFKKYQ